MRYCEIKECDSKHMMYSYCTIHESEKVKIRKMKKKLYSSKLYWSDIKKSRKRCRTYANNNLDLIHRLGQESYRRNRDKICEKRRVHYNKNSKRKRAYSRRQYMKTKVSRTKKIREWRLNNPEAILEMNKRWVAKIAKEYNMVNHKYKYALMAWRNVILKEYKNICQVCSIEYDPKYLHAHHLIFKSVNKNMSFMPHNGILLCLEHHKEIHSLNPVRRNSSFEE